MAIVSRFSVEKATSVKKVAKRTLTQRLRQSVGISDSTDSSDSSDEEGSNSRHNASAEDGKERSKGVSLVDGSEAEATIQGDVTAGLNDAEKEVQGPSNGERNGVRSKQRHQPRKRDLEAGPVEGMETGGNTKDKQMIRLPKPGTGLEQNMPADALLTKKDAKDFLQGIDPAIMPVGIITLEDVLEGRAWLLFMPTISDINHLELIGEEIYDEFDFEAANGTMSSFVPSEHANTNGTETSSGVAPRMKDTSTTTGSILRPLNTRGLNFLRSTSAPPSPRVRGTPSQVPQPNTLVEPSAITPTASATILGSPETTITATPDQPKAKGEMSKESGAVSASENTSDPGILLSTPMRKRPISSSDTHTPLITFMSPPASRTTSPAPSLEAILLDRKRRLAAATAYGKAAGSTTAPSTSGTSDNRDARVPVLRTPVISPKGTNKFKSSPLGGGEQTGVVIAERVKQDIKDQTEDIRIPDEMVKTGPDKEEDASGCL